ncbi:MAG: hypothetical protein J2P28_09460 [Actinobacteria bacterium]|nr:hypothetical protein [Actinomycetota bacterium]MBO0835733.1 hypothetical protein [Actinomycetota bacterium]
MAAWPAPAWLDSAAAITSYGTDGADVVCVGAGAGAGAGGVVGAAILGAAEVVVRVGAGAVVCELAVGFVAAVGRGVVR